MNKINLEEKVNLSLMKEKIKEELRLHHDYKEILNSSDIEIDKALESVHRKHRRSSKKHKERKSKLGFRKRFNHLSLELPSRKNEKHKNRYKSQNSIVSSEDIHPIMVDSFKVSNKHKTENNDSVMNDSLGSMLDSEYLAKSITIPKPFNYVFSSMLPGLERPRYDHSYFKLTEEEKLEDFN